MLNKMCYFAISLSAFLALSCAGKPEASLPQAASMEQLYAENGRPVSVRRLAAEDFSVCLKYPTVVYAASESTAYASLNDVVRSISVKVGDTVRQDDVILAFSPDNQSLRQATLAHANARTAFNRTEALFRNNDVSRQDYDAVRTQYELAAANLKAANDIVYVKAPISGTITQINVRATENVRPGTPLFTVSGGKGYEARFYVGAAEIDRIRNGARAFINDPSQNIEGRITQISLAMDSQKQAFPVTAFFEVNGANSVHARNLVSGMGVDVAVETYRNDKALVLSRGELVKSGETYTAFIADNGSARQVAVEVGEAKGLSYEITNGLAEGDLLICEGQQRLKNNTLLNTATLLADGNRADR